MQARNTTEQRYRSLVLSALYIEAKRRGIPAACLPPDVLSSLGVAVEKAEDPDLKLAARTRCRIFKVIAPDDLGSAEARKTIAELEARLKGSQMLLNVPGGKATRKARKRVDVETARDEGEESPGSVEDLPERI
ncbi:MAG: hypothetical protein V1827_02500 [Candidatus Micrarchaeota archaeon]